MSYHCRGGAKMAVRVKDWQGGLMHEMSADGMDMLPYCCCLCLL